MSQLKRIFLKSQQLPAHLRLRTFVGTLLYRGFNAGRIRYLPFGRILKLRCSAAELETMLYIRTHTAIPVPKVLEVYEVAMRDENSFPSRHGTDPLR